ncbi:MAG: hypothetical protein COA78_16730 [Blastopirellula sp.]|nr:MAG: hypothetical protein COA78_16730 [Blastopirellula sp.]
MTEKDEINPFESPQEEQLLNSGSEHDRLSAETWIMVITPVAIGSLAFSTMLTMVGSFWGVLGYFIIVPGLIHGIFSIDRKLARGDKPNRGKQIVTLFLSMLIMGAILFASLIALCVVCFGGAAMANGDSFPSRPVANSIATVGFCTAFVLFVLLSIFTLPKKHPRKPITEEDE